MNTKLIVLIISGVLGFISGGLVEYLLGKVLPVKPTLRHIATIIIAILVFAGGAIYLPSFIEDDQAPELIITVRVTDEEGDEIQGANVLLVFSSGVTKGLTDSDGITTLLTTAEVSTARLIVTKQGYVPYEENISLQEQTLHPQLTLIPLEAQPIFIRAIDREQKAITGASLTLVLDGGVKHDDLTDNDGFARFSIDCSESPINGELFIAFREIDFSKILTLCTDSVVLDVSLDFQSGEIEILDEGQDTPFISESTQSNSSSQIGAKVSNDGFEAQLTRLFASGSFVTIEVLITNVSDEDKTFRWIVGSDATFVLDEKTGERYFTSTLDVFPSSTATIVPSESLKSWAKYEIDTEERPQELTIRLPNGLRFDNVPVVWEQ